MSTLRTTLHGTRSAGLSSAVVLSTNSGSTSLIEEESHTVNDPGEIVRLNNDPLLLLPGPNARLRSLVRPARGRVSHLPEVKNVAVRILERGESSRTIFRDAAGEFDTVIAELTLNLF